jgi:hypothetical protein
MATSPTMSVQFQLMAPEALHSGSASDWTPARPPTPRQPTSPGNPSSPPPLPDTLLIDDEKAELSRTVQPEPLRRSSLLDSPPHVRYPVRRRCCLVRKGKAAFKKLRFCWIQRRTGPPNSARNVLRRPIETATTVRQSRSPPTADSLTSHMDDKPQSEKAPNAQPSPTAADEKASPPEPESDLTFLDRLIGKEACDYFSKKSSSSLEQLWGSRTGSAKERAVSPAMQSRSSGKDGIDDAEPYILTVAQSSQQVHSLKSESRKASKLVQRDFQELVKRNKELAAKVEYQQQMLDHNSRLIKMYEARLHGTGEDDAKQTSSTSEASNLSGQSEAQGQEMAAAAAAATRAAV